jgi:tetratricopeptide (TPR) repeat protein
VNRESAERIRHLFTAALDHPAESRLAFVRGESGNDAALSENVAQLLALHEQMEALELSSTDVDRIIGTQVGPYEIVRLLGAGGMGRVYLARRADGLFQREVAIKFVAPADDAADVESQRRFDQELRIHASLQHPFIASLLDAGHTALGLTYFVMEYVDGKPITEYCDDHQLSSRARVELFVQVCEAVAHAHRHLVVHRDLKPTNILIDPDGQPKLLDFGIAKLVTRAIIDPQPTHPLLTPATAAYASPEHLAGGPAHTSMDLYALGLVLDELVGAEAATPLNRDLDAIIGKAIDDNPRERYPSADALADDLRAALSLRPVAARRGGAWYRTTLLVRRHAGLAGVAAVAVLALVAAVAVLIRLWIVERTERERAGQQLVAAGALAESTFDIDEQLAVVAGTTGVRRMLVESIASYLDSIQLTDDRTLLLDTADAYRRLADIDGNPNGPNLGDVARALTHYDAALAILDRGRAAFPNDDEFTARVAQTLSARADVYATQSDLDRALVGYRTALALALELGRRHPSEPRYQDLLAGIHRPIGDVRLAQGDVGGALDEFERALAIEMAAAARFPGREETRRLSGLTHLRLGDARAAAGAAAEARSHYEEGTRLLSTLTVEGPEGRRLLRDAALGWARLGVLASSSGGGSAELERAIGILRDLAATDPADARVRRDLMVALVQYSDALAGNPASARAALAEARELARRVSAESPDDARRTRELALVEARLAGGDTVTRLDLFGGTALTPLRAELAPVRVGDTVHAVARVPQGRQGYVLRFGAYGPPEILDDRELARRGGMVSVSGPAPSQTILLITLPRALTPEDRVRLVDGIGAIQGPRTVAFDSHLVWTDDSARLESVPTARGTGDTTWVLAVRERIAMLGDVSIAGRTFPISAAGPN